MSGHGKHRGGRSRRAALGARQVGGDYWIILSVKTIRLGSVNLTL